MNIDYLQNLLQEKEQEDFEKDDIFSENHDQSNSMNQFEIDDEELNDDVNLRTKRYRLKLGKRYRYDAMESLESEE
jgi:hypothetical protein